MTKKLIKEVKKTVVDENGILKEDNSIQIFTSEREPDYVKLYVNDIMRITDIPKSGTSILFAIIRNMNYNNEIALFSPIKKRIIEELGIKEITLKKAIEMFVNKSILIRQDRGLYLVNPYFFGRGKWEDIKKIRLTILYSENGKMILKPEITFEEQINKFENELQGEKI